MDNIQSNVILIKSVIPTYLFINERKKRIAAKKAETAGEEPEEPRPAGPVFRS